jgi:hypothetical protein
VKIIRTRNSSQRSAGLEHHGEILRWCAHSNTAIPPAKRLDKGHNTPSGLLKIRAAIIYAKRQAGRSATSASSVRRPFCNEVDSEGVLSKRTRYQSKQSGVNDRSKHACSGELEARSGSSYCRCLGSTWLNFHGILYLHQPVDLGLHVLSSVSPELSNKTCFAQDRECV